MSGDDTEHRYRDAHAWRLPNGDLPQLTIAQARNEPAMHFALHLPTRPWPMDEPVIRVTANGVIRLRDLGDVEPSDEQIGRALRAWAREWALLAGRATTVDDRA